jgi:diguanylate cyclase (GGDEF)-like protein
MSKPLPLAENSKTRLSLRTVFGTALLSVLVVFFMVIILGYFRLLDFRTIVEQLSFKSLPTVMHSAQLNNQINRLSSLVDRLSKASSKPSQRIIKQQIEEQISEIYSLTHAKSEDNYTFVQLDVVSIELAELNHLVEQRFEIDELLNNKYLTLFDLNDKVVHHSSSDGKDSSTLLQRTYWASNFFEAIALASKSLNTSRLHQIRQMSAQLRTIITLLKTPKQNLSEQVEQEFQQFATELEMILLGPKGLIPLRIEQLRINGRTVGRGNFVHNLINDYAQLLEFKSQQLNAAVLKDTKTTVETIKKQAQLMGILISIAIMFLIIIAYYIQKNVVARILKLNDLVQLKLEGKDAEKQIGGNDEISDLAHTFDDYAQTIDHQKQRLTELTLLDGLTGVANRRALDRRMTLELVSARRHNWPVSILMMDIDYFKAYNDFYGHLEGDECLKKIAKLMGDNLPREGDFLARYGGEEFVCILPDTNEDGAQKVAQSLLNVLAAANIPHLHSQVAKYVTTSIGITTYYTDQIDKYDNLLNRADKALYYAKQNGRNRWQSYEQLDVK